MDLWPHLLAIAAFALCCGGWVALQRWIAHRAPEVKGPEQGGGRCGNCGCGGEDGGKGGGEDGGRCLNRP
jgi:hypothetical protein